MRASIHDKKFSPVVLTLETQHEVDALTALLRYAPTSDAVGLDTQWEELDKFADQLNTQKLIAALQGVVKRGVA